MLIICDTAAFSYHKPLVANWMSDTNWDRNGVLQCAALGRALWEGSHCLQLLQVFYSDTMQDSQIFKVINSSIL